MIAEPYILFQSKDKECAHRQRAPRRTLPLKQCHFHLKVFANLTCDFSFYLIWRISFNFIHFFYFPDFPVSNDNSIHCVQRACVILFLLNSLEIVLWSQICLGECSLFLYTWGNAFSYCWLECYVDLLSSWSVTLFKCAFPYDVLFVFSITGSLEVSCSFVDLSVSSVLFCFMFLEILL